MFQLPFISAEIHDHDVEKALEDCDAEVWHDSHPICTRQEEAEKAGNGARDQNCAQHKWRDHRAWGFRDGRDYEHNPKKEEGQGWKPEFHEELKGVFDCVVMEGVQLVVV